MKLKSIFFTFGVIFIAYISMSNSGGAPAGWTGAPKEGTCSTAGGCHGAGKYTGTVEITGLGNPGDVLSAPSYNITITCTTTGTSPKNGGFEITALADGVDTQFGTFVPQTGQKLDQINTPKRQYLTHSKPVAYANGKATYVCKWNAPLGVDNQRAETKVTFYASVLAANGSGSVDGDNAITATKSVVVKTSSEAYDLSLESNIKVFPNPTSNLLNINLLDAENSSFELNDSAGKNVIFSLLKENNTFDISNLSKGIYFAKVKKGDKYAVKKVIVE
jgi:hypothetical protein